LAWWSCWSAQSLISCKRVHSSLWPWLLWHFLSRGQDDYYSPLLCNDSNLSLAASSIAYQKCIPSWWSWGRSLHWATSWFVLRGSRGTLCKLHRSLYGLKQSPRAWFGKFSSIVQKFGLRRSEADHSVFYKHTSLGKCLYQIVYVDDIVITGNDTARISQLKKHLCRHFQTKDLGSLKYFLDIEVAQSKDEVVISQRNMLLIYYKKQAWLTADQ